jgi:hypothetical protein
MKLYLVTLVYRLPAAPGRRDESALRRGLGRAHASSLWTDDVLEVEVWERAARPSDALAMANRRLTQLWPYAWTAQDPPLESADPQHPASSEDGDGLRRKQDPTRRTPTGASDMLVLHSVSWQYSDHDDGAGLAGVHEPRRPTPSPGHLAAALEVPQDAIMR